jgi:hypothetical protein
MLGQLQRVLDQAQVVPGGSVVVVLGPQNSQREQRRDGSQGVDKRSVT